MGVELKKVDFGPEGKDGGRETIDVSNTEHRRNRTLGRGGVVGVVLGNSNPDLGPGELGLPGESQVSSPRGET